MVRQEGKIIIKAVTCHNNPDFVDVTVNVENDNFVTRPKTYHLYKLDQLELKLGLNLNVE